MSAAISQVDPSDLGLDLPFLTKELDKAKSGVFLGNNAAFLGSIMCSLVFHWTKEVKTAATDGLNLYWNPDFFQNLPPATRKTVLVHELWHPARLHLHRIGSRDPKIWNYACDIRINNDMTAELDEKGNPRYSWEGIEWAWRDTNFPPGMPEEDIYDALIAMHIPPPPMGAWGQGDPGGDLIPTQNKEQHAQAINNVVRAVHQAKISGGAGAVPGDVELVITKFLTPIVPWEKHLHRFMIDLVEDGYTWRRPNRRFDDIYLPSHFQEEGRLTALNYYEDVSGSISDQDVLRFNSEVKYVKDTYNPVKLVLVQFDTRITDIQEFDENRRFDGIKVIGRGGTHLREVREHIIKTRPTAAIIFSDLGCLPMEPLPFKIPIIWVCISNRNATVPFGQLIHIH